VAHFFPELGDWLRQVKDQRDQDRIIYRSPFLLWMGLLIFLLKLGSRRRARFELDSPAGLDNLNQLSGTTQAKLPHPDTLNNFLGKVPPGSLAAVRRQMIGRLVRMKALDHGRLFGHFLVAIDGTGQLHFARRHCPGCLSRKHGQQTRYYHEVLEAKLITPEGLALSLAHEFIANTDPRARVQDCELKAFARLAPQLKRSYPQLRLCLSLDALYANGQTLDLCRRNDWRYFITFKEGSLPALWAEFQTLLRLSPAHGRTHTPAEGVTQVFAWVEGLEHRDEQGRCHRVNAFQCRETRHGQTTTFAWLTNWPVRRDTVVELANRGARCRWKIENEGFNVQKTGGFNLEHVYGTGDRQIRNYYVLMQIAHIILQLLERGSLLPQKAGELFGSLKNLARRLAESIRNVLIPAEALDPARARAIQIRLNSS
jgi:hypothetical protein